MEMVEIKILNANTTIYKIIVKDQTEWRFISCINGVFVELVKSRALISQYSLATLELKEKDKRSDRMTFH